MRQPVASAALIVLVAALAGSAALGLSLAQETEFEAQTALRFDSHLRPEYQVLEQGVSAPGDEERLTATNAAAVESYDIARVTARLTPELGLRPVEVDKRVRVEADRVSNVVRIRASSPTPEAASQLARAYREQFLAGRRRHEAARARRTEKALQDELDSLSRNEERGPRGDDLRGQIGAVSALRQVGSGVPEVIEEAHSSSIPAKPRTGRNVLFGVLFGVLVGVGLAAMRGQRQRPG